MRVIPTGRKHKHRQHDCFRAEDLSKINDALAWVFFGPGLSLL